MTTDPTKRSKYRNLMAFGAALSALAAADVAEGAVVALTPNPATLPNNAALQTLLLTGGSFGTAGSSVGWQLVNSGASFIIGAGNAALVGATGSASVTNGMAFAATFSAAGATGTRTLGFRHNVTGHLGYFQLQFGAGSGPITVSAAFHETAPGVAIPIGGAPIPEPASGALFALGTLAMGAASVRKRKKARAAADSAA